MTGPAVLITRPAAEADGLAATLAARGWVPVLAPMMEIVTDRPPLPDERTLQALLVTSANGVRGIADRLANRRLPVIAVGDATAAAARAAGFDTVTSARGTADELAALVTATLDPAAGALLHAAGAVTTGDLAGRLDAAGFAVHRAVVYRAEPVPRLSDAAAAALADRRVRAVLLYSPRTARLLIERIVESGLADACRTIDAVCLSAAVATAAEPAGWRCVHVAARPNGDALIDTLSTCPVGVGPATDGRVKPPTGGTA